MMYSCAVFPEAAGGVRGDLDGVWSADHLDVAQLHKLHMILRKARVRPGDRVLEFGTGWGSLAIEVNPYRFSIVLVLTELSWIVYRLRKWAVMLTR